MASADMVVADHLLGAVHQVLQEPNRDMVGMRKVDADIASQEVVDISLAVVLGRELLGRDRVHLGRGVLDCVVRLVWIS